MDRRSFATALASGAALGFSPINLAAQEGTQEDVQDGCEGAVAALKGWTAALAKRDFDYLERHLAPDFVATFTPMKVGSAVLAGTKDKKSFIDQDRSIHDVDIQLRSITARRMGDLVITMVFARLHEEFRGDPIPGFPSAAEMNTYVQGNTFGYASSWRELDGRWQCTSHHILGRIDRT
jgi:ketosteroid isomerase-like protein